MYINDCIEIKEIYFFFISKQKSCIYKEVSISSAFADDLLSMS